MMPIGRVVACALFAFPVFASGYATDAEPLQKASSPPASKRGLPVLTMAGLDTRPAWQRVMQDHAVANALPVIAANGIAEEDSNGMRQRYYGNSFIVDDMFKIVAQAGDQKRPHGHIRP